MPLATRRRKIKSLHNASQHKGRLKPIDRSDLNASFDLPINDDKIEKEKLLSSHCRQSQLFNNSTNSDSPIKSALEGLTEDQKTEHFNFCMKLSLENKITTKNAFALHLIDFFSDRVKRETTEATNFQMASLTLDASARIYAVRVDCLHAETMKMSMSLHSTRVNKKVEGNKDDLTDGNKDRAERRKKKKPKKRFLLPSAEKSLEAVNIEMEDEPHEKFGIIKSVFDQAKSGGSLYSSHVISDKCKISFAEAHPYLREKESFNVYGNCDPTALCIARNMMRPIINSDENILVDAYNNLPASPSIESFSYFSKRTWLPDDSMFDFPEGNDSLSAETEELADASALSCNIDINSPILETALSDMFGKALLIADDGDPMYEDVNDVSHASNVPGRKSEIALKMPPPKIPPPRRSSITSRNLRFPGLAMKSFRNSFMRPPSPHPQGTVKSLIRPLFKTNIDPAVGAALFGHCIPRVKKLVQHASEKEDNLVKKRAVNHRITFDQDYETFKKKVIRGKRNKLTDKFIKKWPISERMQPRFHYDKENLFKTFIIEDFPLKMEIFEELTTSKHQSSEYDNTHEVNDKLDHSNKQEIANNQVADEELTTVIQTFDDCHIHDEVDNEIDHLADEVKNIQLYGINNAEYEACIASLNDLQLVPKPEMVKKDTVRYARYSKHVDQKQIKTAIWDVISSHYTIDKTEGIAKPPGNKSLEDPQEHLIFTKPCALKFTKMYCKLIDALPVAVKKKMSIPIAFVSLLHLANEKNLDLEGQVDMKDLRISLAKATNLE